MWFLFITACLYTNEIKLIFLTDAQQGPAASYHRKDASTTQAGPCYYNQDAVMCVSEFTYYAKPVSRLDLLRVFNRALEMKQCLLESMLHIIFT